MFSRFYHSAEDAQLTLQLLDMQARCFICDADICYIQFVVAITLYCGLSLLLALI